MDTLSSLIVGPEPVVNIPPGTDLVAAINRLKKEKNAVILGHYYQRPEIQDIADFVGDSLDLSRKAAATDADVIVFCGVKFMAEVAKILSPGKIVVLPDLRAGCSLETSCPPDDFAAFRAAHPDHVSITYINCSAAVKAHTDIIVTSSNAEHIINQIPAETPILFAPDRHLGSYLMRKTGRTNFKVWDGACIVHEQFSERELVKLKAEYPDAPIAAHPECPEHILEHADHIGSTSSILDFVVKSDATDFIIATEPHIIHQMRKAAPNKNFIGAPGADGNCNCNACPYMELNTLEKLYACLDTLEPRIEVDADLREKALKPLLKMLEMSPKKAPAKDVSEIGAA